MRGVFAAGKSAFATVHIAQHFMHAVIVRGRRARIVRHVLVHLVMLVLAVAAASG